jgi:site-specific recombinase XerD
VNAEIDQFILYLATERGLSDNYQLSTRASLELFARWAVGQKRAAAWADVTPEAIGDFLGWRKKGGAAAATIKLHAVALRILFRFLVQRKILERDPTEFLGVPKVERYLPETLSEPEVAQLIQAAGGKTPLEIRDRAIVELLYASGLRVSELCGARLENLDLEQGFIRVVGKGNKQRLVPVGSGAREALEETAFHFRPTALVGVYLSRFQRELADRRDDITYLRFAFCGELGDFVAGQALDDGIVRTLWLSADAIRACPERHRSPLLIKCMDDYLAGARHPLNVITTDASVYG